MSNYVHNRCPHEPSSNSQYIYTIHIYNDIVKKTIARSCFLGEVDKASHYPVLHTRTNCWRAKKKHPKIILIKSWSCTWPVAAVIIWPVAADVPWIVASSVEVGGGRWDLGDGHCLLRQIRLICMQACGPYLAKWNISTNCFNSRRTARHCSNLRLPASTQLLV